MLSAEFQFAGTVQLVPEVRTTTVSCSGGVNGNIRKKPPTSLKKPPQNSTKLGRAEGALPMNTVAFALQLLLAVSVAVNVYVVWLLGETVTDEDVPQVMLPTPLSIPHDEMLKLPAEVS